jgi:pimeloyl-ACP methyl ester carboxylesterase
MVHFVVLVLMIAASLLLVLAALVAFAQPAPPGQSVAVRRLFLDGRYGQVHVRIARPLVLTTKTALLCLHQSPMSGAVYAALLSVMGADRVVIAPDYPGMGESDAPSTPPEIADYARVMFDVLDSLGVRRVDVMGYHTGSKVGVEMALQQPERIGKLVLVGVSILNDDELALLKRDYADEEAPPDAAGQFLMAEWQRIMAWSRFGMSPQIALLHMAEALRGGVRRWYGHRAAFRYQMRDYLPKVRQPVLVLNINDDLRPYTSRAAPFLVNGRIEDMPMWSHGFLQLYPHEAAALLRRFLDQ